MAEPVLGCAEPTLEAPAVRVRFTGSGAEYFRIWSVNLTLTILTLGLYSAWAKVRRLQYFYRHTELDGAVFDYVASPQGILLGRVIALVLLVLYYVAFQYSLQAGAGVTALLMVALPYLLWQSNRFKARNTRYRGLAFGFDGTVGDAYRVYLPAIVVGFGPTLVVTLWHDPRANNMVLWVSIAAILMLPVLHAMYRRYVQCNLRYGDTPFVFSARPADFAAVWAWGLGAMVVGAIGFFILMTLVMRLSMVIAGKGASALIGAFALGLLSAWISYLLIGSYFTARFQTLVWERTAVGTIGLRCDIGAWRLLRVQMLNTLWVILTLGIYRPFAAIRLARYRLECMTASHVRTLDGVAARPDDRRVGATGEGAAEFFDMDVGI